MAKKKKKTSTGNAQLDALKSIRKTPTPPTRFHSHPKGKKLYDRKSRKADKLILIRFDHRRDS